MWNHEVGSGRDTKPQPQCALKVDLDQTHQSSMSEADHEQVFPLVYSKDGLPVRDPEGGIIDSASRIVLGLPCM